MPIVVTVNERVSPANMLASAGQVMVPMHDSSTIPSQSSSMLLQISAVGAPGVQVCEVAWTQADTVRRQAPTPQVRLAMPSSTRPLQLLSMPSQISAVEQGEQTPVPVQALVAGGVQRIELRATTPPDVL